MHKLTRRQHDTVIAALRFWQARNLPHGPAMNDNDQRKAIEGLASEHGPALDAEEIDSLCEKLNAKEGKRHAR